MSETIAVKSAVSAQANWCIVVADNHGAAKTADGCQTPTPAQYACLGSRGTPFQQAIRRAARIVPVSHIVFTALAEYRAQWTPWTWSIRDERRFVSDHPSASLLSTAAAILSVARSSPSHLLTILPGRCYVAHEDILRSAIVRALTALPQIPEGVITLGVLDMEESVDEDYLVVSRPRNGRGLQVDAFARRPVPWVAQHLRQNGALVASGIMIGYAGVFAAHIARQWPDLSQRLLDRVSAAASDGTECAIPSSLIRDASPAVLRALRWHPRAFRQRVLAVSRCGWSGLKTPHSVARTARFLRNESPLVRASLLSSIPKDNSQILHFYQ